MRRYLLSAIALGLVVGIATVSSSASGPVNRTLDRTLPEIKLTGVSLSDALDFIHDVSGANLHVNWRALEEVGVTRETQVNLNLRGVPLRKVLNMLLTEAGAGEALAYTIDQGVIEITTQTLADQMMYTRVYNVEDLLVEIPNFDNAPDFNLENTSGSGGRGGHGGGGGHGGSGGGGLFSGGNNSRDDDEQVKSKTERADELMSLIKEIIRPEIWVDNGGTASIRYYNGNLVVRAPKTVHEAIGGSWD